jgi:hypothetical protein
VGLRRVIDTVVWQDAGLAGMLGGTLAHGALGGRVAGQWVDKAVFGKALDLRRAERKVSRTAVWQRR